MRAGPSDNQRPAVFPRYCIGLACIHVALGIVVVWRTARAEVGDVDPGMDYGFNLLAAMFYAMVFAFSLAVSLAVAFTLYSRSSLGIWWVCGVSLAAGPAAVVLCRYCM